MKIILGLFIILTFSLSAQADNEAKLMLILNGETVNAQELVESDELAYSVSRNSAFCFVGDAELVVSLIQKWNEEGHFFSGGGGGHTIEKLEIESDSADKKINLTIRSEVTDEVEDPISISRCQ